MTDLLALATRVEQEEPTRELADEVLLAFGWRRYGSAPYGHVVKTQWNGWVGPNGEQAIHNEFRPNPLLSVDAAIAGVPEGWTIGITCGCHDDNIWRVILHKRKQKQSSEWHEVHGKARTEARARTAANLRARAAMEGDDAE